MTNFKVIVPLIDMVKLGWSFGDDFYNAKEIYTDLTWATWEEHAEVIFYGSGKYRITWQGLDTTLAPYTVSDLFMDLL